MLYLHRASRGEKTKLKPCGCSQFGESKCDGHGHHPSNRNPKTRSPHWCLSTNSPIAMLPAPAAKLARNMESAQYDIENAQMKRQQKNGRGIGSNEGEGEGKEKLPSPVQSAVASTLAFSVGAMVPLVGASFIAEHKVRLVVMEAVACLALAVFGAVCAVVGKTQVLRSCLRVAIRGVMAMAITFGLTKLAVSTGLQLRLFSSASSVEI